MLLEHSWAIAVCARLGCPSCSVGTVGLGQAHWQVLRLANVAFLGRARVPEEVALGCVPCGAADIRSTLVSTCVATATGTA